MLSSNQSINQSIKATCKTSLLLSLFHCIIVIHLNPSIRPNFYWETLTLLLTAGGSCRYKEKKSPVENRRHKSPVFFSIFLCGVSCNVDLNTKYLLPRKTTLFKGQITLKSLRRYSSQFTQVKFLLIYNLALSR